VAGSLSQFSPIALYFGSRDTRPCVSITQLGNASLLCECLFHLIYIDLYQNPYHFNGKSYPIPIIRGYNYVQVSKNSNRRTKYTVKPSLLPAQFLAVISLEGKYAKKGIL
jgi:hypothetical protein